jgi:predicted permease
LLLQLLSSDLVLDVRPDLQVLAFTSVVGVITGILFGSAPAFRASAMGAGRALNAHARASMPFNGRMASALVISQVALSLLLLIGAGFFVRTLQNLQQLDPGFRRDGVLVFRIDLRRGGYEEGQFTALYQQLLEPLGSVPGVASVSLSTNTPLSGLTWTEGVRVEGQPRLADAHVNSVSPRYFETMRTPLLTGRDFTLRDHATAPKVAIVNEAFVRRNIPDGNPLGKRISVEHNADWQNVAIVGVVRDAVFSTLREPPAQAVYLPYFQDPNPGNSTFEIYAAGSLAQVVSTVLKEIHARLPDAPLEIKTLSEQVNASLVQERTLATLASSFGLLALALAAVGLYGVMAYRVVRRTGEIGIRLALGATRGDVLWLMLRNAVRLVASGVFLGGPMARVASRFISSMLFGVSATDPITLVAAVALLVATAIVASYLPARRASRLDPMAALRYE